MGYSPKNTNFTPSGENNENEMEHLQFMHIGQVSLYLTTSEIRQETRL